MVNGDFAASLRELVADYTKRIADAQEEVKRLIELRSAAAMLLDNETGKYVVPRVQLKPFSGMNVPQALTAIFKANGNHPLHVSELTKMLLDGGWQTKAENPKFTVTGALVREEGGRFERTGSNTFRLKEKGGNEARS